LAAASPAIAAADGSSIASSAARAATLGDGVRVGVYLLHVLDVARDREEVVGDLYEDLAADQQVVVDEHVEGVANDPLARVLDGNDAEVRVPALHHVEYPGDVDLRDVVGAFPEVLEARKVGERRTGTQKRHAQRFLESEGGRDDFPVDRLERLVRKGAGVGACEPAKDLDLTLRDVEPQLLIRLDLPHLDHGLRASIEEEEDLVVQRVDLVAQFLHPIPGHL
jgi:hypothetical protein